MGFTGFFYKQSIEIAAPLIFMEVAQLGGLTGEL